MEKFNPSELKYCEGCVNDICIDCTVDAIKQSDYGKLLSDMGPRFGMFQWEDEARFRQYLGNDVDPLLHGIHQAEFVALPFIELQNSSPDHRPFTREEAKMLLIGNVLHDAHEGLPEIGDVPYPEKKKRGKEWYEFELETNLRVVSEILSEEPESGFMKAYRATVGDLENWSFAGRAFNAIEMCGYSLTGLRAWSLRNHSELSPEEQEKSATLGREVLTKNMPVLKDYKDFPYAAHLLRVHENALDAAHS